MGRYEDDLATRAYIDERLKEINEKIYPIRNGTDCSASELRAGIKREKELAREIKAADKDFYMTVFDI